VSQALSGLQIDALEYLYGGGDEHIECRTIRWVITRQKQKCVSVLHKGAMTQPKGSRMVLERAKVEGEFGSCYTCESCLKKAIEELKSHD